MQAPESEYAIHEAAREGRVNEIEAFLNSNPRLADKKDADGRVPLHWAVARHQMPIIQLLVGRKGFDPDVEDELSWTPLMMAANIPEGEDVVRLLLQKEADPNLKNTNGQTALHFAASKGNLEAAKDLIASKASTRTRDRRSQIPLHRAAAAGWSPMVNLLLDNQSPINTSDDDGLTPLHHAIAEGRGDTALLLLRAGADSTKRDRDEQLAIDLAPDAKVRNYILTAADREGIEIATK